MTDLLWCATLKGAPRTKKNHQQILRNRSGRPFVAPSKDFLLYQEKCLWQIRTPHRAISEAVNVRCVYYMPDHRRVDLTNLLEATDDILVKAGVLGDDCSTIVAAHDGSRVLLDRKNPRVEIEITRLQPLEPSDEEEGSWIPLGIKKDSYRVFACPRCRNLLAVPESYYHAEETGIMKCPKCGLKMKG